MYPSRFLAIVGPSGSGKSSLVKAGLIPALWRGEIAGSEPWYIVDMLPGTHPLDKLEVALMRVAATQTSELREQLERDERGLLRVADLILPDDESDLVLVIDQLEEIFTLAEDETSRVHFLNLLFTAVTDKRSRVRVVITLRADFYDRPLQYSGFGELIRDCTETVLPLTAKELESAVVNPAKRVGVNFEEGLVATIVSEVNYQPSALPLLQYGLTELFENQENRTLTQQAYQQLGGIVGALAARAEDVYRELDDEGKEIAHQMFLRLVTLGEGVEDTRRRTPRDEIDTITANQDLLADIVDTFTEYRLLALDHDSATRKPTVEVAHEAILREWERLRNWLNESRDDVRMEHQLANMVEAWRGSEHDKSYLLRGSRLELYERWAAETQIVITPQERDYLQVSLAEHKWQEAQKRAQQEREVKLETRARRVLQGLVVLFLIAAVVSGSLAFLANGERHQAEDAQGRAEVAEQEALLQASIGLSAQAMLELEGKFPERAVPLAITALEDYPYTWQAERALGQAVLDNHLEHTLVGHTDFLSRVAWSPSGEYLATSSEDGTARIWNSETGEELLLLSGHADKIFGLAWAPNESQIVTSSNDGTAKVWDAANGEENLTLSGHADSTWINAVAWSPDGSYIATAGDDGTARVWNAMTGEELVVLSGHADWLADIAWSPAGRRLATSSADNTARIWDASTGQELLTLSGHTNWVFRVQWSADGMRLATGSADGTVKVWDTETGEELLSLSGHTDSVRSLAWSPTNDYIASAARDGSVRVWDAANGKERFRFNDDGGSIFQPYVAWAPDGSYIAAPTGDNGIIIWDVTLGEQFLKVAGHHGYVTSLSWSPDGEYIASASEDNTAKIWHVAEPFLIFPDSSLAIDWSPHGQVIATGSFDGTVVVWDATASTKRLSFSGHEEPIPVIVWSPDSSRFLTTSDDSTAKIWDGSTGEELLTLSGHDGNVGGGDWSPLGDHVVTTGYLDGTARIWDASTGKEILTLLHDHDWVTRAMWSPDGTRVVTSAADGVARIWHANTGEMLRRLPTEGVFMSKAIWSPDGTRIVTASDDFIRIWDVLSGEELLVFAGHLNSIWGIEWSPSGNVIATVSLDGTAKFWNADTGALLLTFTASGPLIDLTWSPDGQRFAFSAWNGQARVFDLRWQNIEELISYAYECCYQRDLTDDERELFGLSPRNK